jgi:hypothetical protein
MIDIFIKSPSKSQLIFPRNCQADPKMHIELQRTQSSYIILKKKSRFGGHIFPDLQPFSKATTLKLCGSNIRIDQESVMESPEINPHFYGHLIFHKSIKMIQLGEPLVFSTSVAGTRRYPYAKQ